MTNYRLDREHIAMQIEEMLDAIYMCGDDAKDFTIRIGIWDDGNAPYSLYALLYRDSDNAMLTGESSYGADDLAEAIDKLCTEVGEFFSEPEAEVQP